MSGKPFMPPPIIDPELGADEVEFDEENPEWTEEDFARAKTVDELPPDMQEIIYKAFPNTPRGPQKAPKKVPVSLRLTQEVVERFKADGPGWQTRMDEALKKAVGL